VRCMLEQPHRVVHVGSLRHGQVGSQVTESLPADKCSRLPLRAVIRAD
jgi:hypothetical protein